MGFIRVNFTWYGRRIDIHIHCKWNRRKDTDKFLTYITGQRLEHGYYLKISEQVLGILEKSTIKSIMEYELIHQCNKHKYNLRHLGIGLPHLGQTLSTQST
jgi:hypothetical protein